MTVTMEQIKPHFDWISETPSGTKWAMRTGRTHRLTFICPIRADARACLVSRKRERITQKKIDIYDQPKPYIERNIFTTWLSDTFLWEEAVRREKYNYPGPLFLFMDSVTAHSGDGFEEMCTDNGAFAIFISPLESHPHSLPRVLQCCKPCEYSGELSKWGMFPSRWTRDRSNYVHDNPADSRVSATCDRHEGT
jgi:hypothetical protein